MDVVRKLRESFPSAAIKYRKGAKDKEYAYIDAADVIERLILATAEYSWEVLTIETCPTPVKGNPHYMVHGRLSIPGLGYRDGIGTAVIENEDSLKAAETDALKRAAVKFGVALDMYEPTPPDALFAFTDRCEFMGYVGSKSVLCKTLIGRAPSGRADYGEANEKSTKEWERAIASLSV